MRFCILHTPSGETREATGATAAAACAAVGWPPTECYVTTTGGPGVCAVLFDMLGGATLDELADHARGCALCGAALGAVLQKMINPALQGLEIFGRYPTE